MWGKLERTNELFEGAGGETLRRLFKTLFKTLYGALYFFQKKTENLGQFVTRCNNRKSQDLLQTVTFAVVKMQQITEFLVCQEELQTVTNSVGKMLQISIPLKCQASLQIVTYFVVLMGQT